jgi:hypothetical protein
VGHSARGRPIVAYERADPTAPATLVVGVIHGSEPAGLAVIRDLRTMPLPPASISGSSRRSTRTGSRPARARTRTASTSTATGPPLEAQRRALGRQLLGPRPMSEPENRAMRAFILKVKPALTIWYHQPLDEVYGSDPHVAVLKRYARLSGLPYHRLVAPPGAATRWERKRFPRGVHFVAEFPAGGISAATARRNARAVLALAERVAPVAREVALVP